MAGGITRRARSGPRPASRGVRSLSAHVSATALLAAAMLGGAIALGGVLVGGPDVAPSPAPTAAVVDGAGPAGAPAVPPGPQRGDAGAVPAVPDGGPANPKAAAFLKALRAVKVPASRSGFAELRIAGEACAQLAAGTSEKDLARRIPMALPTLTEATAAKFVTAAQRHYC